MKDKHPLLAGQLPTEFKALDYPWPKNSMWVDNAVNNGIRIVSKSGLVALISGLFVAVIAWRHITQSAQGVMTEPSCGIPPSECLASGQAESVAANFAALPAKRCQILGDLRGFVRENRFAPAPFGEVGKIFVRLIIHAAILPPFGAHPSALSGYLANSCSLARLVIRS